MGVALGVSSAGSLCSAHSSCTVRSCCTVRDTGVEDVRYNLFDFF
jgi:hypothetical protein